MSKLDDILKPIFSYGVDWTEFKDKDGPNGDHDVSVYAAQIKSDMRAAIKKQIKALLTQIIKDHLDDITYTGAIKERIEDL